MTNPQIKTLSNAELKNQYFTLGGTTFKSQDVAEYSQNIAENKNYVKLKNGCVFEYPMQEENIASVKTKDGSIFNNQSVFVGNLHGCKIKGSEKSDDITLVRCDSVTVDVKGGNGTLGLGGDKITLLGGEMRNHDIKVIRDKNDTVRSWQWGLKGKEQWVKSDSRDNERIFQSRKLDMYH